MTKTCNCFSQGIRDGLPICLGYLSVAFAFGIFSVEEGLKAWQALAISMTNVTSAGQLAGVPVMVLGLPIYEMILTQFVINLRYALMSISLSQKLDPGVRLLDRFVIAFLNTDEIFAVASGREGMVGRRYLYGLILTPFLGWSTGTFLGAIAGNILPQAVVTALGIAIYAMFIAIFIPPAKHNRAVLAVVLLSAGMSCLFHYLPLLQGVSSGLTIILCAVIASCVLAMIKPIPEEDSAHE